MQSIIKNNKKNRQIDYLNILLFNIYSQQCYKWCVEIIIIIYLKSNKLKRVNWQTKAFNSWSWTVFYAHLIIGYLWVFCFSTNLFEITKHTAPSWCNNLHFKDCHDLHLKLYSRCNKFNCFQPTTNVSSYWCSLLLICGMWRIKLLLMVDKVNKKNSNQ